MTMLVHGFPSRTAALQFEWAWQHPDDGPNLRGADGRAFVRQSLELNGNIETVRLMVNSHPYSTWPLHIKLFTEEAEKTRKDAAKKFPQLPEGFTYTVELEGVDGTKAAMHAGSGRNGPIDVHDRGFTVQHLTAAAAVRALGRKLPCIVCSWPIDFHNEDPLKVSVCSTVSCYAVSHILCLATSFFSQSPEAGASIIPRGGTCLSCDTWVLWGDIIRGADRRKFDAKAMEDKAETMDDIEETDEMDLDDRDETDGMDLDGIETTASPVKRSKHPSRPRKERPSGATSRSKPPAPSNKFSRSRPLMGAAERPQKCRSPKKARPAGAPYSTLAGAGIYDGRWDLSASNDNVDNVTDDGHSIAHAPGALLAAGIAGGIAGIAGGIAGALAVAALKNRKQQPRVM